MSSSWPTTTIFLKVRNFEELLSVAIGGMSIPERILALKVNGSIIHNLLYQQWFSMAPSRLGEHSDTARTAVKYLIEPQNATKGDHNWPSWSSWEEGRNYQLPGTSLVKIPEDIRNAFDADRNYLRTRLDETLSSGDFVMSLKIQPFDKPGRHTDRGCYANPGIGARKNGTGGSTISFHFHSRSENARPITESALRRSTWQPYGSPRMAANRTILRPAKT